MTVRLLLGAAAAAGSLSAASADPEPQYGWREVTAGADVTSNVWLLYSGITVAPFGHIYSDGLRLRAVTGYGRYGYTADRRVSDPGAESFTERRSFNVRHAYADILIGYLKRFDPLTAKAFIGLSAIDHDVSPFDNENFVQGFDYGITGVIELWLNMGSDLWGSLDLSWKQPFETAAGRLRVGYRILPTLSAGVEGKIDSNLENRSGRGGLFLRYDWAGGEISASAGVASELFVDQDSELTPYATINWLTQY